MEVTPIHVQLRNALLLECASGKFSVGQRFYSNRKICHLWKVSNTTATSSIEWLVAMKIIKPRPRSGYYMLPQAGRRARLLLHKEPEVSLPSPQVFSTRRFQMMQQSTSRRPRKLALVVYGEEPSHGSLETGSTNPARLNEWCRSFFEGALAKGYGFQAFINDGDPEQQRRFRDG